MKAAPEIELARRVARYALDFDAGALPDVVIERVKQRIVDSLACALGAYGVRPVTAAIAVAAARPHQGSSVFGTRVRTSPDLAAFANGAMVRYLDYNDGYMAKEPGHPSDNIPACLAVAEAEAAPGRDLIAAIVVAYEIQMRLQEASALNTRGWDHVNYLLISVTAAAARLMRLSEEQTSHAIALALNGHIAMRQVRAGEISDWKAASAANAARNAIFCAELARHGMEGPSSIFEGGMGFMKQVSGAFALDPESFASGADGDYRILRSLTKTFPTNGELHTAVWAALKLRSQIDDIGSIAAIHIDTTEIGYRILASDAQKWRPKTRETADHSLPYTVARALIDGDITVGSYAPDKITDPLAHQLMDVTTVAVDAALTDLFPQRLGNRVAVTLKSGEALIEEVLTGPGSVDQPMTSADFDRKFRRMASQHLDEAAQEDALGFVASLERARDYTPLFEALIPPTSA